jgi:hypothetical protein
MKSKGLTLLMIGVAVNEIAGISIKATNAPIGR